MQKVFGIGLSRTGINSLTYAMVLLDYKAVQYPWTEKEIKGNDFLSDLPIVIDYKKLDKKYPNSKFILTVRDYGTWIDSLRNHYRRFPASKRYKEQLEFRKKCWGTIHFNTKLMTKKYYEHLEDIKDYFKNREKDLLIMDITKGDGWQKLCKFIGKKVPKRPFPKLNEGKYKS